MQTMIEVRGGGGRVEGTPERAAELSIGLLR